MSMNTVGFIDHGSNDGYVSVWQIYLQGSDFDVDKAFTILNSLNKVGIYEAWSPLFDYSSIETLIESENLPRPNGSEINVEEIIQISEIVNEDGSISYINDESKEVINLEEYNNLDEYLDTIQSNSELSIVDYVKLLRSIDYNKLFITYNLSSIPTQIAISDLITSINEHNTF